MELYISFIQYDSSNYFTHKNIKYTKKPIVERNILHFNLARDMKHYISCTLLTF